MWIDDHMLLGVIATREPYARGAVGVPGLGLGRGYAPVALILVPGLGDAIHLAKRVAEGRDVAPPGRRHDLVRSEEHTSELQSLMRISYAVFCLKTKIQ